MRYKNLNGISSRKEFYKLIERERERANRNNHRVSLVVFNLDSFPDNGRESRLLIQNIIKEKRKIDELGWYDKRRVGVLLPYTSSNGARKFSVRLCSTLNFIMPDSFCYLFTYPLEDKTESETEDQFYDDALNSVADVKTLVNDFIENKSGDFVSNTSARSVSK